MLNEDYRDMSHALSGEERGGGKDVERTGEKLCKAFAFDYAKVLIILNNVLSIFMSKSREENI